MKYLTILSLLFAASCGTTVKYVYVEPTLEEYEAKYPQFNTEPAKPADGLPDPYTMVPHVCTTFADRWVMGQNLGGGTVCH